MSARDIRGGGVSGIVYRGGGGDERRGGAKNWKQKIGLKCTQKYAPERMIGGHTRNLARPHPL